MEALRRLAGSGVSVLGVRRVVALLSALVAVTGSLRLSPACAHELVRAYPERAAGWS